MAHAPSSSMNFFLDLKSLHHTVRDRDNLGAEVERGGSLVNIITNTYSCSIKVVDIRYGNIIYSTGFRWARF